jgi:hypothetical protein
MKFEDLEKYIVDEATIPVDSLGNAFTIIIKKARYIISLYSKLFKIVEDNEAFIVNDLSALDIDHYFVSAVKRLKEDITEKSIYRGNLMQEIESIEQYLEVAKTTEDSNYRYKIISEYIPNFIKSMYSGFMDPENGRAHSLREVINCVTNFINKYENYGFKEDEAETKLVKSIELILSDIVNIGKSISGYSERLGAYSEWMLGAYHQDRKFRPKDLQETEIAYHASLQAVQLFEKGFTKGWSSKDSMGLGGASETDISFSLDVKVCQNILITYKQMWLIANGQWKISSVLDHVRLYSKEPREDKGGKYTFDEIVNIHKRQKSDPFPPKTPEQTLDFFRTALYFINTPVSRNPVFWGFDSKEWVSKLKQIDIGDIGIIKAKILTKNASEFLVAEREIRIPPTDILEMISIIK